MRVFLLLALVYAAGARADDWPAPQVREVFSKSRAYFVRVTPGKSIGDTVGFAGAPKGEYATADFYRLEPDRSYRPIAAVKLLNPIAPVDFFVTDRGFLITLDNWHNRGYGKVFAIYDAAGKPVRAYELADLFSKTEIDAFPHSVSSIAWHKDAGAYIRDDQQTFYLTSDEKGSGFIFEVAGGSYQYCETREGAFVCRDRNAGRVWRTYRELRP
jgi:hypothetical protein